MSMSDTFFGRVFHARRECAPCSTVSLATYFHADVENLAGEDISRVLAVANAKIFQTPRSSRRVTATRAASFGHRTGLLATMHQIAYFKA